MTVAGAWFASIANREKIHFEQMCGRIASTIFLRTADIPFVTIPEQVLATEQSTTVAFSTNFFSFQCCSCFAVLKIIKVFETKAMNCTHSLCVSVNRTAFIDTRMSESLRR